MVSVMQNVQLVQEQITEIYIVHFLSIEGDNYWRMQSFF